MASARRNRVNYLAELVGVFGHPVAENPSVVMYEAAFQELGLNWRYLTIEVFPEDLADAVKGLRAFNMRGINLTMPHKVEVLKYLDEVVLEARLMGAVNTVRQDRQRLIGENTDGKGFLRSLMEDAHEDPNGKRVVVLGAGGAARAITVELALAGTQHITIVNRSEKPGKELTRLLNEKTPAKASFVQWETDYEIPPEVDVLVNATSIGLFPDINAKPPINYDTITKRITVCDVIPNPPHTPFLNKAEAKGAKTVHGLGMLVYQGAIGLKMWTGLDAPVEVMKKALKEALDL